MFVRPGPPWSRKIGAPGWGVCARMRVIGKCDQARVRVVPVLGDDERAAVGRLVRVGAVLQGQLTRVRAGRHGDGG